MEVLEDITPEGVGQTTLTMVTTDPGEEVVGGIFLAVVVEVVPIAVVMTEVLGELHRPL